MANNADLLEILFLKDTWTQSDVVDFLSGYRVNYPKPYSVNTTDVFNLITGEQLRAIHKETIIQRHQDIKGIWEGSNAHTQDMRFGGDVDRIYVLRWARDKAQNGDLWEGFKACLKHALEQRWVKTQDYAPQEETPEEPEPVKDKPESQRETDGLLRLVGAMRDILTSEDGEVTEKKKSFTSNNDLINHILENYEGEGLSITTLKDRFKEGKEITKYKKKKT